MYEERDEKDTIFDFKSFSYTSNLETKGSGVNVKFGVIVKPVDWLRLGAAVHTPTSISMHDNYSNSMKSTFDNGDTYEDKSPSGSYDYTVTTPFRMIGSLGFVIKKKAVLNADYEYIDYTYAQLRSSPNVFADVNSTIRSKYTSTSNIRLGGEIRFDPLTFRLGYAMYGSPFKTGDNSAADRNSYSAGIGFRDKNYFIDFGYVLTKYTESGYLYDPEVVKSSVRSSYKTSAFVLTMGVRF